MKDQIGLIKNLHMSLIPQTSSLLGTFFAASYYKTSLVDYEIASKDYFFCQNLVMPTFWQNWNSKR